MIIFSLDGSGFDSETEHVLSAALDFGYRQMAQPEILCDCRVSEKVGTGSNVCLAPVYTRTHVRHLIRRTFLLSFLAE